MHSKVKHQGEREKLSGPERLNKTSSTQINVKNVFITSNMITTFMSIKDDSLNLF